MIKLIKYLVKAFQESNKRMLESGKYYKLPTNL